MRALSWQRARSWVVKLTIIAVDFVRGVVVVQTAPNQYEPVRFDPKTLQVY